MRTASLILLASFILSAAAAVPSWAGTQDDAKVALHLMTHAMKTANTCADWTVPCSEFQTNGTVGVAYDAYLVVAEVDPTAGVAGLSCGILYDSQTGHGVDVYSWRFCGGMEFPNYGDNGLPWPDSDSGNRMTWNMDTDCQRSLVSGHESEGAHVVAGSFYLYAYSNGSFDLIGNPRLLNNNNEFAVADCIGVISDLDVSTAAGSVHFTHDGTNHGYNPCTGLGDPPPDPEEPPPPPPDPTPRPEPADYQSAAFMLHVTPAEDPRTVCQDAPLRKTDVVTAATSEHNGKSTYFVYVLGTPQVTYKVVAGHYQMDNRALLGLRFGIDYEAGTGQGDKSSPLKVFSWNTCGASWGSMGNWPAPLSGNTLVLSNCERSEIVPFGYFYVAAYAPSTLSMIGFPTTGKVEYSSCYSTQEFIPVDPIQVGWVSLHGGSIGTDSDGCNPGVEPCTQTTTPVRPTTWGQLKSKYKVDPN